VSGGQKRDQIHQGANKWGAVGGSPFDFDLGADETGFNYDNPGCTGGVGAQQTVHWEPMDIGSFVAEVTVCPSGGDLVNFKMGFDTDSSCDWSVDGTPAGGECDLQSFAAHEFGHATGGWLDWATGHWSESSNPCPTGSSRHTMCRSVPNGSTYMRSLEEHDEHTLVNAYP
jgi:hypothetical protein